MATTVIKAATLATNLDIGLPGATNWQNPANALTSNNLYAINDFGGSSSPSTNVKTHYLYVYKFQMGLPTTAIIEGLEAIVHRKGTGTVKDYYVGLIYEEDGDLTITTPGQQLPGDWPNTEAPATYGASDDLWNKTWTVAEVNADNFGFAISAEGDPTTLEAAQVDYIEMKVYYHQFIVETPTGGIHNGGSATAEVIYNVAIHATPALMAGHGGTDIFADMSGGATATGSAAVVSGYIPVGGSITSGKATVLYTANIRITNVTSHARAGGTATHNHTLEVRLSGGTSAYGSATVVNSYIPTGTTLLGGETVATVIYVVTASGGSKVNHTAFVDPYIMEGGVRAISVTASIDVIYEIQAAGGLNANYTVVPLTFIPMDGGVTVNGQGVRVDILNGMGGAVLNGEADVRPFAEEMRGGTKANGTAFVDPYIPTGAIHATGSAEHTMIMVDQPAPITYAFTLRPDKDVPPDTDSNDYGVAWVRLDAINNVLHWHIRHSFSSAPNAVRFRGPASKTQVNSTIIRVDQLQSTLSPIIGSSPITAAQKIDIQNGLWYLFIRHDLTSSRIRGQLTNDPPALSSQAQISLRCDFAGSGGNKANGSAVVTVHYKPTAQGGIAVDGSGFNFIEVITSGGVVSAGESSFEYTSNPVFEGRGSIATGEAIENSIFICLIESYGVFADGIALKGIHQNVGGVVLALGQAEQMRFALPAVSGGAFGLGSFTMTQIYAPPPIKGGVRCFHRTIASIIKPVQPSVHRGYALAMKSNNILKKEPKPTNKLLNPIKAVSPKLSEDRFQIQEQSDWCDFGEPCDHAYLAPIVKKRQGRFIPAKHRKTAKKNLGIATVTIST